LAKIFIAPAQWGACTSRLGWGVVGRVRVGNVGIVSKNAKRRLVSAEICVDGVDEDDAWSVFFAGIRVAGRFQEDSSVVEYRRALGTACWRLAWYGSRQGSLIWQFGSWECKRLEGSGGRIGCTDWVQIFALG
jgi:hypothetical protein